ncbi:MAG: hypothetical protein BGO77_03495 [Caedibacter sp. 37-49]|nr:MAG: hypothetical protein BGO77_03495 [Caedibacter sp. 37-49]
MSTITLRLPDDLLKEASLKAEYLHMSRSDYIRKAVENFNKEIRELEKRKRLIAISKKVRQESLEINADFEMVEHDIKA